LPATPQLTPKTSGRISIDDGAEIWFGLSGKPLNSKGQTPVLFLHGGLANSDYFGNQIACLEDSFPIISIDSRGHGRSLDGPGPITYDRMTLDVIHVLDVLNVPKVAIVGWSDGGIIGLDLAMNYSSRVERVFAFGASYNPSNSNDTSEDSKIKAPTIVNDFFARSADEYKALSPTPDQFDVFADKMDTLFSTLPQWNASAFAKIPTLYQNSSSPLIFIVHGEQEEVVNRDVPFTLRDWIPGSQLVLLPGVSHFAFIQDPSTFTAVVSRFL
ncbi:Alpha/Beta hydrolase protein, partial [Mycena floridula]